MDNIDPSNDVDTFYQKFREMFFYKKIKINLYELLDFSKLLIFVFKKNYCCQLLEDLNFSFLFNSWNVLNF